MLIMITITNDNDNNDDDDNNNNNNNNNNNDDDDVTYIEMLFHDIIGQPQCFHQHLISSGLLSTLDTNFELFVSYLIIIIIIIIIITIIIIINTIRMLLCTIIHISFKFFNNTIKSYITFKKVYHHHYSRLITHSNLF